MRATAVLSESVKALLKAAAATAADALSAELVNNGETAQAGLNRAQYEVLRKAVQESDANKRGGLRGVCVRASALTLGDVLGTLMLSASSSLGAISVSMDHVVTATLAVQADAADVQSGVQTLPYLEVQAASASVAFSAEVLRAVTLGVTANPAQLISLTERRSSFRATTVHLFRYGAGGPHVQGGVRARDASAQASGDHIVGCAVFAQALGAVAALAGPDNTLHVVAGPATALIAVAIVPHVARVWVEMAPATAVLTTTTTPMSAATAQVEAAVAVAAVVGDRIPIATLAPQAEAAHTGASFFAAGTSAQRYGIATAAVQAASAGVSFSADYAPYGAVIAAGASTATTQFVASLFPTEAYPDPSQILVTIAAVASVPSVAWDIFPSVHLALHALSATVTMQVDLKPTAVMAAAAATAEVRFIASAFTPPVYSTRLGLTVGIAQADLQAVIV